jgi:hypothetical protein
MYYNKKQSKIQKTSPPEADAPLAQKQKNKQAKNILPF